MRLSGQGSVRRDRVPSVRFAEIADTIQHTRQYDFVFYQPGAPILLISYYVIFGDLAISRTALYNYDTAET